MKQKDEYHTCYNPDHNFLEIYDVVVQLQLTTSKRKREEIGNLRILGNKEILGKSQIWVETQPSAQSLFQKLNLAIAVKKHAQTDIKFFLSCPVFLDFSILFQIFCLGLQLLGDAILVIQKLIVMSEKGDCWHGIKTDILRIPYSIFLILIPKSVLQFRKTHRFPLI